MASLSLKHINKTYPNGFEAVKDFNLEIDHVQGDPFAAPSRLHIQVAGRAARIPGNLYDSKCKKMAVADYLLRNFAYISLS